MKLVSVPDPRQFAEVPHRDIEILLYGHRGESDRASVGASIHDVIKRSHLQPELRAWDFLTIALSIVATDQIVQRHSADGWTRQLSLTIAVNEPEFWEAQKGLLSEAVRFLTTDLWELDFLGNGHQPELSEEPLIPDENCVSLLSGGMDSLIGAIDLTAQGANQPYMVSQVAQGDKNTQAGFAANIGGGLRHLQLNHNTVAPWPKERSQRARSLAFIAYGVLAASTLKHYKDGERVPLYICENGFISINPPLTLSRLGSLSTRTTHPIFLDSLQRLLHAAGLHVQLVNPYQFSTKGEMLRGCSDQAILLQNAHSSTSCGKYARYGYTHCGRCVPCLVRRAAYHAWGEQDQTDYRFNDLWRDESDYARFDDVRSVAMAITKVNLDGLDKWLGASLNSYRMGDVRPYQQTVERGLRELESFFHSIGIM